MKIKNATNKTNKEASVFYSSKEWREAKKIFLESREMSCNRCGSTEKLCVDHIKPIKWYWDLRCNQDNLQILCNKCNLSKGSGDSDLWSLPKEKMKQILEDRYLERTRLDLEEKLKSLLENKDDYILKHKKNWLIRLNNKEISVPEGVNTIKEILDYFYNIEVQKIEQKIKNLTN